MADATNSAASGIDAAKALKQSKARFKLHLSLIANDSGETGEKAAFIAYREGPAGLQTRLGKAGS